MSEPTENQNLVPFTPNSDLAGLLDRSAADDLSPEERLTLATLLAQDDRVDIVIPEDTPAERLWETVQLCAKVFNNYRRAGNTLKLLIGRALVLIQKNPSIYENNGFRSLDAFMSDEVKGLPAILGISRGELYKAKSVAESNPTMPMAQYREIGFSKLGLLAPVTQEGNSDYGFWLEQARTSTYQELKTKIYASDKQIPEGSLEADVFTLPCTKDQKDEINELLDDPKMQQGAGTKSRAQVLVNGLREAQSTWMSEAEENGPNV